MNVGLDGKIVRVMLACPSDIREEVDIFFQEVNKFNQEHAEEYGVALIPKHWSTHAHPQLGDRPQAVINRQLADQADFLIAIFGMKLGTATGQHESGTVEEIFEFYKTGRIVKVYFSESVSLTPKQAASRTIQKEVRRLEEFRQKAQTMGLLGSYNNISQFRSELGTHLLREIRHLRDSGFLIRPQVETTQTPTLPSLPETLLIFRRSVERLRIQWKTEAESHYSRYAEGKLIMARLGQVVSSHLPEFGELFDSQAVSLFDDILGNAKRLEQAQPVMGREFNTWFWDSGTQVFKDVGAAIETLQTSNINNQT